MNLTQAPFGCPFCGQPPKVAERPDNIDGTGFFCAVACYCGGYSATAHKMAVRPTPEAARADAIAAWNRREPSIATQKREQRNHEARQDWPGSEHG